MKKSDLVAKIATQFSMTKVDAEKCIEFINAGYEADLLNDGETVIHGLGALKVKVRAARIARNPKTGASINVPEKKTVTFRPGSGLKEKINS